MESIKEIWNNVLSIIQQSDISRIAYDVWISSIEPRGIEDGEMVVCVKTEFQKKTIAQTYANKLLDALQQVLGIPLGLRIITKEATPTETIDPLGSITPIQGNGFPANVSDEEYTFDNFVVGSSNKFAHAASQAVANKPAGLYNPLFIYGGSGLGKTHLLCAICSQIQKNNPQTRILYTKGETMANELIEAIQNKSTSEFHAKYRQVDVFLVDDVQFLSGKEQTQVEFFHTFETLHSAGKQIVLTSDRPPKEIAALSERLRSRFEMGLLADIQPPDLETRIAIIRRKAQTLDLPIQEDVVSYIANQLKSNIRQLEGVVKRMRAQYLLNNEQPNLIAAQNAIRDIRNDNQPVPITVERIITEVARTMNVNPEDIRSSKRSAPISQARQVAAYVVRSITNLPMESIGEEFGGRDHSTIVYAIQRAENQMKENSSLKNLVNDIIKNISES
ncbi:MAG: chromosomal replication initiator protein DnaA [Clostridia bacterium]|nr:chromosomal replication initiator protein DnaA [Clostridia bacterium]